MATWVIYMPRRGSGVENFETALQRGTWGAPAEAGVAGLRIGDEVVLVHDVHSSLANPPEGIRASRRGRDSKESPGAWRACERPALRSRATR